MLGLLLWGALAYMAGALSVVGVIWWWCSVHPSKPDFKPRVQEAQLPEELAKVLKQEGGYKRRETCLALNLLLQFFFQENRYDAGILHWLTGMLTQEFSMMLQEQKALSKIIKTMQIHHLDLGTEFPIIKAVTPKHVDLNAEASQLEQLDICVELEYNGNFQLVVDATSRFKKSGKITIKVAHLSGNGRLQFSRHPFTHWSFSFYQEPMVTFDISSKIQGLHIPRLTSFIATQLRSILKRKHTLPYYKLRAAPLIKRITFHEEEGGVVPPGKLEVTVVRFSRLQSSLLGTELYTSVAVTEVPLVSIVEDTSGNVWTTQELTLRRPPGAPVGILFRNLDDNMLAIEVVYPGSPAHLAGLKKNDIILTINQQPLTSGPQAAKLFSAASSTANVAADIKLRIKRCIYHEHRKMAADSKLGGPDTASATNDDSQGDISNSTKSTPDSSHNNSPELKRRILDLNASNTEAKLNLPLPSKSPGMQEKSPVTVVSNSGFARQVDKFAQEKPHQTSSNQSSKASTPTAETLLPPKADTRNVTKKLPHRSRNAFKILQSQNVVSSSDPVIQSDFEFDVEEENKFLHIGLWSKGESLAQDTKDTDTPESIKEGKEKKTETEKDPGYDSCNKGTVKSKPASRDRHKDLENIPVNFNPEDALVGYINIPLTCIIPETTSNTKGYVVKVLPLTPPDPKCPEMASSPLQPHKGFTPAFCYGDITLAITYQPVDRKENMEKKEKDKSNSSTYIEDDSSADGGLSDEDETTYLGEIVDERPHDFKRTHFHSATQCDFCKKKIWLKDANQCGECGIICHKKCVAKCEQETVCDVSGLRFKEQPSVATPDTKSKTQDTLAIPDNRDTPEIITTSAVGGGCESDSPGQTPPVSPHSHQRRTLGSFLAQVASAAGKGSLKRTGSAHNLAPPSALPLDSSQSRSLPPSPQHSPHQSRKASIVGNPFHIDDDNFDGIEMALDRIAMYPHDERLITMARESAKDLYSDIASSQRSKKINSMMEKLQAAVDREGEIRVDLARQEKETADAGDDLGRTKVSLQITQCDARTQSLALLTLHFCTALQYCTDETEDEENVKEAIKEDGSEVTKRGIE